MGWAGIYYNGRTELYFFRASSYKKNGAEGMQRRCQAVIDDFSISLTIKHEYIQELEQKRYIDLGQDGKSLLVTYR